MDNKNVFVAIALSMAVLLFWLFERVAVPVLLLFVLLLLLLLLQSTNRHRALRNIRNPTNATFSITSRNVLHESATLFLFVFVLPIPPLFIVFARYSSINRFPIDFPALRNFSFTNDASPSASLNNCTTNAPYVSENSSEFTFSVAVD